MTKKKTKAIPETEEITNENIAEPTTENVGNEHANEDAIEILPEIGIIAPRPISVCIPFLAAAAQGNELLYAIRSMECNFRENFKVVIIGDKPEWLNEETVTYIAHECVSKNPQIDVIEKIKLLVASDEVTDKFILTNDDIYFVSPVSLADIETLKISGTLNEMSKTGSLYDKNRQRTIEMLEANGLSTFNFANHQPVVFEKEKIVELFEEFNEINDGGYLFSSIYFNRHFAGWNPILLNWQTDNWALRLISSNPDADKFKKLVNRKKWLNNSENGYSKLLVKYLERKFSEKTKFEV